MVSRTHLQNVLFKTFLPFCDGRKGGGVNLIRNLGRKCILSHTIHPLAVSATHAVKKM